MMYKKLFHALLALFCGLVTIVPQSVFAEVVYLNQATKNELSDVALQGFSEYSTIFNFSGTSTANLFYYSCGSDEYVVRSDNAIYQGAGVSSQNTNVYQLTVSGSSYSLSQPSTFTAPSTSCKAYGYARKGSYNNISLIKQALSFNVTGRVDPIDAGIIEGLGSYVGGESATVEFVPNEGYVFDDFLVRENGDYTVVKENPYTFDVTSDIEIVAYATKDGAWTTVEGVVSPSTAGSINGLGEYPEGSTIKLEALANQGYSFINWEDGSTDPVRTFESTGGTVTVQANFALTGPFEITGESSPEEGGTIYGLGMHDAGGTIPIFAIPSVGYRFVEWEDGSTDPVRTITNLSDNMHVKATFEPIPADYTITVSPQLVVESWDCEIYVSPEDALNYGSVLTYAFYSEFNFAIPEGYYLVYDGHLYEGQFIKNAYHILPNASSYFQGTYSQHGTMSCIDILSLINSKGWADSFDSYEFQLVKKPETPIIVHDPYVNAMLAQVLLELQQNNASMDEINDVLQDIRDAIVGQDQDSQGTTDSIDSANDDFNSANDEYDSLTGDFENDMNSALNDINLDFGFGSGITNAFNYVSQLFDRFIDNELQVTLSFALIFGFAVMIIGKRL